MNDKTLMTTDKILKTSTPRPWKTGEKHQCRIMTSTSRVAFTCDVMDEGTEYDDQKANAKLIVLAVNSYERDQETIATLREALREADLSTREARITLDQSTGNLKCDEK